VLREVAHAGSFAGAAAVLRHTPSAVSQQIAALERGAGAVLVHRSTRGVTLTDAGRVLLATADPIHAELQAATQQLRALRADGPQSLTVVTFPSAGETLLAPALVAAGRQPVEVTVAEAEPDEALGSVRDGRADLALVYHFHTPQPPRAWRAAAGPGSYTALLADHLRLLVPADHPLAGRQAVSLAEFATERWVDGWGDIGNVLEMLAAVSGFQPRVACRSSDYRFMSALVAPGSASLSCPASPSPAVPTCATCGSPPSPPATSAPTSRSGTSRTQRPNDCSRRSGEPPRAGWASASGRTCPYRGR
jgi:DNA-binding transcriptional LysR family regulator